MFHSPLRSPRALAAAILLLAVPLGCRSTAPSPERGDARADARALLREARELREAGQTEAARERLDAALQRHPDEAEAALERAEVLLELGVDTPLAVADATKAAKTLASRRAHFTLGKALSENGDLDGALAAFWRAMETPGPEDRVSIQRLEADLLARAGRMGPAIRAWEAVRDADPADVSARVELARLYEEDGRIDSAENEHRALVASQPTVPVHRRRYAAFLQRQGRSREAVAQLRAVEEEAQEPAPRRLRTLPKSHR